MEVGDGVNQAERNLADAVDRFKNSDAAYWKSDPINGQYWDEELQASGLILLAQNFVATYDSSNPATQP